MISSVTEVNHQAFVRNSLSMLEISGNHVYMPPIEKSGTVHYTDHPSSPSLINKAKIITLECTVHIVLWAGAYAKIRKVGVGLQTFGWLPKVRGREKSCFRFDECVDSTLFHWKCIVKR